MRRLTLFVMLSFVVCCGEVPASAAATPTVSTGPYARATSNTWFGSFGRGHLDHAVYNFTPTQFVAGHVLVTADPGGRGEVAKYSIDNSDQPYTGAPPRGDLFSQRQITPGSDVYISIPVRIPAGLPLEHDNGPNFFQWAQLDYPGAPQPALGLDIAANGDTVNHYDLGLHYKFEWPWVGPRVDGKWHTVILHVYVEPDNRGSVQLWWDGVQQTFNNGLRTFNGPTINANQWGAYIEELDIDQYRAYNSMPGTVTIYHGAPAIGPTRPSVEGGAIGAAIVRNQPGVARGLRRRDCHAARTKCKTQRHHHDSRISLTHR